LQPPTSNLQPPASVQRQPASVTVQQLAYAQLDGTRNAATLVSPYDSASGVAQRRPAPNGAHPAILFLHWYEPPRPTSNRTEFLAEAVELAQSGVVSLLVATPWTVDRWFLQRGAASEYEFTAVM